MLDGIELEDRLGVIQAKIQTISGGGFENAAETFADFSRLSFPYWKINDPEKSSATTSTPEEFVAKYKLLVQAGEIEE